MNASPPLVLGRFATFKRCFLCKRVLPVFAQLISGLWSGIISINECQRMAQLPATTSELQEQGSASCKLHPTQWPSVGQGAGASLAELCLKSCVFLLLLLPNSSSLLVSKGNSSWGPILQCCLCCPGQLLLRMLYVNQAAFCPLSFICLLLLFHPLLPTSISSLSQVTLEIPQNIMAFGWVRGGEVGCCFKVEKNELLISL